MFFLLLLLQRLCVYVELHFIDVMLFVVGMRVRDSAAMSADGGLRRKCSRLHIHVCIFI